MNPFIKIKKFAQRAGIASGWNQHVDKYTKQKGNKLIRRILRREANDYEN